MPETSPILQDIQDKLGPKVLETSQFRGDDIVVLDRVDLRGSFRILKEDPRLRFDFLSDITAVDYWKKKEPRFELVYQLLSLQSGKRLRVRVPVSEENAAIESLTPLWRGANFLEREIWDLFGINSRVIHCARTTRSINNSIGCRSGRLRELSSTNVHTTSFCG